MTGKAMADDNDTPKLPIGMAGAVNLMVHPLAGTAALTALGFTMASQAFGLWAGAVAGANSAVQKMLLDQAKVATGDAAGEALAAAQRIKAQADTVMEQAKAAAARRAAKPAQPRLVVVASTPAPKVPPAAEPVPVPAGAKEAAEALLARPLAIEKPAQPDDLKAIGGIGPKLEQVLNRLGIWTYAQISSLTATQVAWLDEHLGFPGRVGRDDWIGQAARLAAKGGA